MGVTQKQLPARPAAGTKPPQAQQHTGTSPLPGTGTGTTGAGTATAREPIFLSAFERNVLLALQGSVEEYIGYIRAKHAVPMDWTLNRDATAITPPAKAGSR